MTVHVKRIEMMDSPDEPNSVRVVAEVSFDHPTPETRQLWVEVAREYADALTLSGNPWLLAMAVPASLDGQALCVDAPVDPALYEHVHQLMRIWHTWGWTPQSLIPIEANTSDSFMKPSGAGRTGLFFSGGVDSLFSLLADNPTHYPERQFQVDDLINIWGLNQRATNRTDFEHGLVERQQVAQATGKTLLSVRTNLKEVLSRLWDWSHPMLIASLGLALESRYQRLLMASDADYSGVIPRWVHPLEVPLFSTRGLEFVHDGGAYAKYEKLEIIGPNELVQHTLNVCTKRHGRRLNCGRCIKCLRTMVVLDLAGVLPVYSVFDTSEYPQVLATAEVGFNDRPDLRRLIPLVNAAQRFELLVLIEGALKRYERQTLTRRARIERFLSRWVMPARAAQMIGRAIDRAYTTFVKR